MTEQNNKQEKEEKQERQIRKKAYRARKKYGLHVKNCGTSAENICKRPAVVLSA